MLLSSSVGIRNFVLQIQISENELLDCHQIFKNIKPRKLKILSSKAFEDIFQKMASFDDKTVFVGL